MSVRIHIECHNDTRFTSTFPGTFGELAELCQGQLREINAVCIGQDDHAALVIIPREQIRWISIEASP